MIYKILRVREWAALQADGETDGAPIDQSDGFIHFSSASQVAETAAKHFAGADDLVLALVDDATLGSDLKWEVSRGGALFPHLYRRLKLSDVVETHAMPLENGAHVFPDGLLLAEAHVDPTRAQFEAFKGLNRDHPIEMLNLVRFRGAAAYPDGHDLAGKGLSGAEAYANYGRETAAILEKVGGSIVWRGGFDTVLIGPDDEAWDACFIARYPTAHAFLAMVSDPDYQVAVVHRQAAVLTSRLIRTKPSAGGATFG